MKKRKFAVSLLLKKYNINMQSTQDCMSSHIVDIKSGDCSTDRLRNIVLKRESSLKSITEGFTFSMITAVEIK